MRRTGLLVALSASMFAAAPGVDAQARPPQGNAATARPGQNQELSLREAREALQSADPERVSEGLEAIANYPSAESVQAVIDVLRRGVTDTVADKAIETLGQLGRAECIEELSNLLRHRRFAARVEAVESLARITDPRVRGLIESGLHDSQPEVRAASAVALGQINARSSVGLLFRAFERGVPEAAEAIGRLGSAEDAVSADPAHDAEDPRRTSRRLTLSMWVTHAPISVLLSGIGQFMNRRDIPVPVKVKIIERLEQRAASAAVRDFLQRWVQARPRGYAGADLVRAQLAIRQIQGGGR